MNQETFVGGGKLPGSWVIVEAAFATDYAEQKLSVVLADLVGK